jgi:hypothetical protein
VFPDDVQDWANREIAGTIYADNFPYGKVTEGWYRGFLHRQGMLTRHLRPLEMARHEWLTEQSLADYYKVAKGVLLKAGVARVNPDFQPDVPYSQEILITHPERIIGYDETKLELECTKGGKGKEDMIVRVCHADDGEGVVAKTTSCASATCGRRGDGNALPPMIVFSAGETWDPEWSPPHCV